MENTKEILEWYKDSAKNAILSLAETVQAEGMSEEAIFQSYMILERLNGLQAAHHFFHAWHPEGNQSTRKIEIEGYETVSVDGRVTEDLPTLAVGTRVIKLGAESDYATGRKGVIIEMPGYMNSIEPDRARVLWDTTPSGEPMRKPIKTKVNFRFLAI